MVKFGEKQDSYLRSTLELFDFSLLHYLFCIMAKRLIDLITFIYITLGAILLSFRCHNATRKIDVLVFLSI